MHRIKKSAVMIFVVTAEALYQKAFKIKYVIFCGMIEKILMLCYYRCFSVLIQSWMTICPKQMGLTSGEHQTSGPKQALRLICPRLTKLTSGEHLISGLLPAWRLTCLKQTELTSGEH